MNDLWNREPASILGLVQAGIVLIVSFGVHLNSHQIGAILAFTTMLTAVITRSQVHSNAAVDEIKKTIVATENKTE